MNTNELIIKQLLINKVKTLEDLAIAKREAAKRHKTSCPSNVELLKSYHKLVKNKTVKRNEILENLLRKRKVRSLSGVVVVSVLSKPYPCPGKCIYCPSEKGLPKSYLSGEPAVERAKRAKFNPYLQTQNRLESLKIQGHPTDKIELRIIGGSWTAYPRKYQVWFIANCFRAANNHLSLRGAKNCHCEEEWSDDEAISEIASLSLAPTPFTKGVGARNDKEEKKFIIKNLEKEEKRNEKAKNRIVGISIETRPDLIDKKEILNLRKLGITMVELGVQTIYDDILKKCQRGHLVKETIKATKLLKDAGFKVMYQIMPNLPGSDIKRDFECVKTIFENPQFKPDWLKIYPCVVCKPPHLSIGGGGKGTKLYQMYKKGEYKSYSDKKLIKLLIKIKQTLPYWVRVARLFRDIPAQKIESGSKFSNLRQIIQKEMKKTGKVCHCIRCREVKENYDPKEKLYLLREDYDASDGKEIFLSFENNPPTTFSGKVVRGENRTKLYSLLRLRIPAQTKTVIARSRQATKQSHILVLKNAAIIRELHTYGQMLPISEKSLSPQHKGLGKKLIKEAEKITRKEFGLKKIAVISGIGAREYFRKLGYRLKDTYMVKTLKLNK